MKRLADCRILLVDDAKPNLDILVEGLREHYKLSIATSGEMALQVATRMPPDLVLLDIRMPGMDGYEVCRRLRGMPETAEVPIIFLSSLDDVRDKARGFDAGANDYVTKPFDLLEIHARVGALLKAKAYNDAVKEQIAGDLRVAREIQMGMIPRGLDGTGRRYGVELAALLEPAREVGGDLYGVYTPTPDRLVLVMGDVSGKGIPAALFMMRTATMVHMLVKEIAEPERILARLNDELAADNPSDMFVTLLCAVYDRTTGRVAIANGGHCRPVVLRPGEPPRWAVGSLGTALGFDTGIEFERTELHLAAGDALVLYTDGVIEAFDDAEALYGDNRLLEDLRSISGGNGAPAANLASGLLGCVREFSNGAPQSDDIAVLVLRADATALPHHSLTLELHATLDDVMRGVDELREFGSVHQVPEKDMFALALALEEAATNLVRHGQTDRAGHGARHAPAGGAAGAAHHAPVNAEAPAIRLGLEHHGDRVVIELRDRGVPFDPTEAAAPEKAGEEGMADGGWGIHLVRHYADDVSYRSEGGENVLRITRQLRRDRAMDANTQA
ncbi:MAG TPA: SpoIIE family protein phosphatase [Longimicrobiales bacterium]|nr:SpoIIE family protein phosphatase [Longimicrobiales bacterium]